jgi:hypothetical protein
MQGSATCLSDIGKTQALGSERTEGIFYMGFLFFFSLVSFFLSFPSLSLSLSSFLPLLLFLWFSSFFLFFFLHGLTM